MIRYYTIPKDSRLIKYCTIITPILKVVGLKGRYFDINLTIVILYYPWEKAGLSLCIFE